MERLPLVTKSSLGKQSTRNWTQTWLASGLTLGITIMGGLTVFASTQIMTASHQLALLQQEEGQIQQNLRTLQTEYAQVSSLERVEAYAQQAGLTNSVTFAGSVKNTLPVAQRTR